MTMLVERGREPEWMTSNKTSKSCSDKYTYLSIPETFVPKGEHLVDADSSASQDSRSFTSSSNLTHALLPLPAPTTFARPTMFAHAHRISQPRHFLV